MSKITYTDLKITVKVDGKIAGFIRYNGSTYCYFPKGQREGGEAYPTLEACKRSLESD